MSTDFDCVDNLRPENRVDKRGVGVVSHGRAILNRPWGIIGESSAILKILDLIERVGPSDVPVLITGEPGVGKELVALALHAVSGLRNHVVVNSAGLPESLVEAEMFGHVRGAFTGADRDRPGLLETADGGTFILDEIGDLPLPGQGKFLRALQNGEVRRLGSAAVSHVQFRLIAATNKNLAVGIKEGWFREDLFGRINGLRIDVPPLRDRPEDIQPLAELFLGHRDVPPDVVDLLVSHSWPGNVRELELKLRVACALGRGRELRPEDFAHEIRFTQAAACDAHPRPFGRPRTLREVERAHIECITRELRGNLSRAAEVLGIDRGTLRRKLSAYGRTETELSSFRV